MFFPILSLKRILRFISPAEHFTLAQPKIKFNWVVMSYQSMDHFPTSLAP